MFLAYCVIMSVAVLGCCGTVIYFGIMGVILGGIGYASWEYLAG